MLKNRSVSWVFPRVGLQLYPRVLIVPTRGTNQLTAIATSAGVSPHRPYEGYQQRVLARTDTTSAVLIVPTRGTNALETCTPA